MIGKFVAVPGCKWRCPKWRWTVVSAILSFVTILAGAATLVAQQAPAQPPAQQAPSQPPAAHEPDNQPPSSQEASQEESTSRRKVKPRAYKNWSFNVGGGASVDNGATKTYVRGGGVIATAGVARNYSKYFGLRADFQWDNLPLRNSALQRRKPTALPVRPIRLWSIPSSTFQSRQIGVETFVRPLLRVSLR